MDIFIKRTVGSVLVGVVFAQAFGASAVVLPVDTVRPDGMYNSYVIYEARLTAGQLDEGKFVLPPNIVEVAEPDIELEIVYAHDQSIAHASNKAPIFKLFPEAERFAIGGDTLSRREFVDIPVALLNSVRMQPDGVVEVDMRPSVLDISTAFRGEQDGEYVWFKKHLLPLPSMQWSMDNVEAYPTETYISVDGYLRSPVRAKMMKPQAIRLSMYGNKLHLEFFSDPSRFIMHYPKEATILEAAEPPMISEALSQMPNNTQMLIWNGRQIIGLPIDRYYR